MKKIVSDVLKRIEKCKTIPQLTFRLGHIEGQIARFEHDNANNPGKRLDYSQAFIFYMAIQYKAKALGCTVTLTNGDNVGIEIENE